MAAYIATSLGQLTPVGLTGGAAAVVVSPAGSQLMVKLFNPDNVNPAYWGGSGVTASTGIPFTGETEWIPAGCDIYCYSDTDVTIRGVKGT
jgi:hypothetical protein